MVQKAKKKEEFFDPYSKYSESDVEYVSEQDEQEVIFNLSFTQGKTFNNYEERYD